jgi:arsenate reductase (thioredoxin)
MSNLKYRVLFVCIHNSARSQMAEAFFNKIGGDLFEAESAGLEPGKLNPIVVEVMQEVGIDISTNKTKTVDDMLRKGTLYSAVITVCDAASAESCPVFPGKAQKIGWSFPDPSALTGSKEEILEKTRQVRDEIEEKIKTFIDEASVIGIK